MALIAIPGAAFAAEPTPWQVGLQPSASPLMDDVTDFHTLLLWIISAISVFVLLLLLYTMWRFREGKNPTPSRTTHNTLVEVVWTIVPLIILVFIAFPSFKLLYKSERTSDAPITIKVRGHQWYWSYVYEVSNKVDPAGKPVLGADQKPVDLVKGARFQFASRLACRTAEECQKKAVNGKAPKRLLDVDNQLVIPVNTKVRLLVVGMDVIHSFAMPSMGVKVDAVPGRTNQTWIQAKKPGVYYGQCSEICGSDHAFMPIAIRAVPVAEYEAWLASAKTNPNFEKVEEPKKSASVDAARTKVAAK